MKFKSHTNYADAGAEKLQMQKRLDEGIKSPKDQYATYNHKL